MQRLVSSVMIVQINLVTTLGYLYFRWTSRRVSREAAVTITITRGPGPAASREPRLPPAITSSTVQTPASTYHTSSLRNTLTTTCRGSVRFLLNCSEDI